MIGTKGRSGRRAIADATSASDTILGYSDPSHHNTKIVYRSKEGGGSNSMLFQYEKKSLDSKSSWLDERSIAHRHSDGTILSSNYRKLPVWMTKPGSQNYRRYRSIPNFLAGEPYGYSNIVYNSAAMIFERLAIRQDGTQSLIQYGEIKKDDVEPLQFDTPKIKRQAFELAYQALKYQELLEEILINSGFLFAHPMSDDQMALVVVMLYDFQNRKWGARCRVIGEEIDQDIVFIENALWDHKIRLAAALAKCRVKNQSLSIDYILPESVRQQEKCGSLLPQSTWVNTMKTTVDEVAKQLTELGFCEVCGKQENMLPLRGKYFHRDSHCDDVILFPWDQKEALKGLDLVSDGMLIMQDKTSSLAVQAMASLLTEDDEYDVVHTDVASGLTTAHLAIVLHNVTRKQVETRGKMYSNPLITNHILNQDQEEEEEQHKPTLFACGVRDEKHRARLQELMDSLGITNVKLLSARFEDLEPENDPRFERVKLILCTPQCTRTAVSNPIEFMLTEGDRETYNILRDLSHGKHGETAKEAGRRHLTTLKNALRFRPIQACVYVVRSIHEAENENVVNSAIKWQRHHGSGSMPFRVCPPTVPLMSHDLKSNIKSLSQKFLYLRQSPTMNGCFLAVLSREIGSDEMTVKDIIRRAALKGLVKPTQQIVQDKQKTTVSKTTEMQDSDDDKKKSKKKSSTTSRTSLSPKKSGKVSAGTPPLPSKSLRAVHKLAETKSPDADDVNRLLGLYNSRSSGTKADEKNPNLSHVTVGSEFPSPSMRFSQENLGHKKKLTAKDHHHKH